MRELVTISGSSNVPSESDLNGAVAELVGVRGARVVQERDGRVSEVHVLADRSRAPKQIVRDVSSLLLTRFGLEIDYRSVSVVQLDEAGAAAGGVQQPGTTIVATRPAVQRVVVETQAGTATATVFLQAGDDVLDGSARGPGSLGLRLVARAAVAALETELRDAAADVEHAESVEVGGQQVAVVLLRLASTRGDQVVTGSAPVRKDVNDAVARATMSALNRILER